MNTLKGSRTRRSRGGFPLPSCTEVAFGHDARGLGAWRILLEAGKVALGSISGYSDLGLDSGGSTNAFGSVGGIGTLPQALPLSEPEPHNGDLDTDSESGVEKPEAPHGDNLIGIRVLGFFMREFWDLGQHPGQDGWWGVPYEQIVSAILSISESSSCYDPDSGSALDSDTSGGGGPQVDVDSEANLSLELNLGRIQLEKLFELGVNYRNHLMRLYIWDDSSMEGSDDSSQPSSPAWGQRHKDFVKDRTEVLGNMAMSASFNGALNSKVDAKQQALLRDGYRCMISNTFDYDHAEKYQDVLNLAFTATPGGLSLTRSTYLFPLESTESAGERGSASDISQHSDLGYTDTNVPTILELLGLERTPIIQELLTGNVDQPASDDDIEELTRYSSKFGLANVLTLSDHLHKLFNRLVFWLEEVSGQPNTYDIIPNPFHAFTFFHIAPPPFHRVTFRIDTAAMEDCNRGGIPPPKLPDRNLIAIRGVCARVAYMSGALARA
ncbi:hypothetical protein BDN72DRAFT_399959 [Pluteus cervinus]|uniref:Uncharacterized protein n=1 Tax=Pluteus cervinus TaxID=181527 RepID=A0ACD3B0R9_9AGAR|nr:hypothetical protein BDN72DRAFT_399959 [Pluteus cervinus]